MMYSVQTNYEHAVSVVQCVVCERNITL